MVWFGSGEGAMRPGIRTPYSIRWAGAPWTWRSPLFSFQMLGFHGSHPGEQERTHADVRLRLSGLQDALRSADVHDCVLRGRQAQVRTMRLGEGGAHLHRRERAHIWSGFERLEQRPRLRAPRVHLSQVGASQLGGSVSAARPHEHTSAISHLTRSRAWRILSRDTRWTQRFLAGLRYCAITLVASTSREVRHVH